MLDCLLIEDHRQMVINQTWIVIECRVVLPVKRGQSTWASNLMLSICYAANPHLYCIYSRGWDSPLFTTILEHSHFFQLSFEFNLTVMLLSINTSQYHSIYSVYEHSWDSPHFYSNLVGDLNDFATCCFSELSIFWI